VRWPQGALREAERILRTGRDDAEARPSMVFAFSVAPSGAELYRPKVFRSEEDSSRRKMAAFIVYATHRLLDDLRFWTSVEIGGD
jgi:hypothetical protein